VTKPTDARPRLAHVARRIERLVADGDVEGAALAVALHGEPLGEWYAGEAAPGLPSGPDVLWPLASISKLYTAAAVMALVEDGLLTLSLPVHRVLPAFTGDGREAVTLRHLLTHSSGLIYESPRMEALLTGRASLDTIVDEAYGHPLRFPPGERIAYSDYGIALAARVASAVAGMPFPEIVRRRVLEPAGLRGTFFPTPPAEQRRVAHVSGALGEGTEGAMYNSPYGLGLAHPAFGVTASVGDLLRFGLCFAPRGPRFLSAATVGTMTTDQTGGRLHADLIGLETAAPQPWGIGFVVRGPLDEIGFFGDLLPPGSFGHPGASGCVLAVNPVDGIVVAFVSNRHANTGVERWLRRLALVLNAAGAALTR